MNQIDVDQTLNSLAEKLRPVLEKDPVMIGIHTGGAWIAQRLHDILGMSEDIGTLDISFYRDDFTRIGLNPQVKASDLPFDVDDRHVILVDDVLHTGRTIRAAMNEIFDYGRPASILLVVLICRDGRELPIQADIIGETVALKPNQEIKLTGPDNLALEIQEVGA
ncbi:MAG: bifunctional pyr operon transcriptional regulator/uracil phosphoribosyltransferase PyrR [Acidiferrobacterales bacterium]|nr:bifunctional pyr operon transcriptional regulator/uracil phosphoribosyltransferase PyrR [Acidiferrobacterales bacterium]